MPEILYERITYKNNSFEKGIRWFKGIHPKLGTIIKGITGWETVQEFDRIMPISTYDVITFSSSPVGE